MRFSRTLRAWLPFAALIVLAPPGRAAPPADPVAVRSGNHPGFGRIVIDTKPQTAYRIDQDGDRLSIRFGGEIALNAPPAAPRNVTAIATDGPEASLTLVHGAKVRAMRLDGRVVLDIMDPPGTSPPAAPPRKGDNPRQPHTLPAAAPLSMASSPELGGRGAMEPVQPALAPAPAVPVQAQPLTPPPASPPESGVIETTEQTPPGRDVMPENGDPIGLRARRVRLPDGMDGSAFLVPFAGTAAAAAFREGDSFYVVFDERRPVDTAALASDPVFRAVSVRLLPSGTLIRVPLPPTMSLALTQMAQGWRIAALPAEAKLQPIAAAIEKGQISLAADQPGDVVSLADPETGATLLAGTQHRPGQGVLAGRRGTEFILRPTIQGVVAEPLSDAIALKQVAAGFSLTGRPEGLTLSPQTGMTDSLMEAAHLTRRVDFSAMPSDALLRLATKQLDSAAMAPPMARGLKHRDAAQTLMSLGLSAEAESLLHMAAEQDPRQAASADTAALTAIAALLAGRPDESAALMDPRLDGTDEITLWRAIRQAMLDQGSPAAAAAIAATAPLVFQYPAPIRDHILPLMAETMIEGGAIGPAARLLKQRKDDPALAYARALLAQAEGASGRALAMLDALASGHDQFDRARSAVRAVELRLAMGTMDKAQAADALDKLLYVWRGDARELALRERVADLRGETGAWRVALTALRTAETDFPEKATVIHEKLKDMFAATIRAQGDHSASPIDLVAMVDENADLISGTAEDDAVQRTLADRLLMLDLPERAKPVLDELMRTAKTDAAKARFGLTLATLDSREGNDNAVQAALGASDGHDLPPELAEQRTILRAAATARLGDPAAGAAMLAALPTAPATEARAHILETAADWAGAAKAWSDYAVLTIPDAGMLNAGLLNESQTRTVLSLTTATARAGDDAGLDRLRAQYGSRVGAGPLGDMFRLLTAEPVKTTADIGRSQREISLAASLPSDLKALQAAR